MGATSTGCALGGGVGADGERSAFAIVAMALGPRLDVHRTPDGPLAVQLANPNVFHQPLVALATERAGDWVKVLLPMRPNGARGWGRLTDVPLALDPWRV